MSDEKRPGQGFMQIGNIVGSLFPQSELPQPPGPEESPNPEEKTKEGKTKKAKSLPQKAISPNMKLAQAAAEIITRPDQAEAAFQAREMLQCTLPHRDPGEVPVWIRRNGNYALGLQPGVDLKTGKTVGLPFGELPRLIMIWIVTEAIRTKSRTIKFADTLNDFLREVGGDPRTGGGKRGDAKRIREQMHRLFSCRISFQYSEGDAKKGYEARLNMEVAKKVQYWWDFKNPEQVGLFESEIVLGEAFFEAIIENPVPVDWRAVVALKHSLKQSSFAIDVYTWVSYRLFRMQQKRECEISIPLKSLKEQFGAEYSRLDNFKAALIEALGHVRQVYPDFDYRFEKGYFILCDRTGRSAIASQDKEVASRQLARFQPYNQITEATRQWFQEAYPLHSVEEVFTAFDQWRQDKGIQSQNTDKHFRSFVIKNWFKG
ncbi:MAG: hypothetical protein JOZ57_12090 [Abitibacteriaceae bacterium]|nr:hypothetical protein [Abditibacteriaceae bacterium]